MRQRFEREVLVAREISHQNVCPTYDLFRVQGPRGPDNQQMGILSLGVPLPLFNRNQGNLLSALRRADQARDDLEAERLGLNQALADAYQRAEVASTQVTSLREQIVPAAQSAYDAAATGFALGKFAFTDVLDAQRTLFQSRTQYLRALADRYRSIADVQRYVPPEAGASINPIEGKSQ